MARGTGPVILAKKWALCRHRNDPWVQDWPGPGWTSTRAPVRSSVGSCLALLFRVGQGSPRRVNRASVGPTSRGPMRHASQADVVRGGRAERCGIEGPGGTLAPLFRPDGVAIRWPSWQGRTRSRMRLVLDAGSTGRARADPAGQPTRTERHKAVKTTRLVTWDLYHRFLWENQGASLRRVPFVWPAVVLRCTLSARNVHEERL